MIRYLRQIRSLSRNARLYLLSIILNGLGSSIFLLFFNLYILSEGYSRSYLGLLTALPFVAGLIAGLPIALWADRTSRKQVLLLGGLIGTAATAIFFLSPGRTQWIVASILLGVGQTAGLVTQAPFLMENSGERERAILFSLNFALFTLAGFVGNLVGGLLPEWFGIRLGVAADTPIAYRATLLIAAGLVGLSLLPIFLLHERRIPAIGQRSAPATATWLRWRPRLVQFALPSLLISLGAALLLPYMNVFFKESFHIGDEALGVLFSLSAIMVGVGSLAGPPLAERVGKIRVVVLTELLSLVFLLCMGFVPWMLIVAPAFLIRGAFMNIGTPLYSAFVMEQTTQGERAVVSAVVSLASGVGQAAGALLSGQVQDRFGFAPLFIMTAFLYILAAGLLYRFFGDMEAQDRSPKLSRTPAQWSEGRTGD